MATNKFIVWIKKNGGRRKTAFALDMSEQTIRNWMEGTRSPTASTIQFLIRKSGRAFTAKDILACRKF